MHTIGYLSKKFNISRSALLYYDSIKLLSPSKIGDNNYRYYSEQDSEKLQKILAFRNAGIELKDIKKILDDISEDGLGKILLNKAIHYADEIQEMKKKQLLILEMIKTYGILPQGNRLPVFIKKITEILKINKLKLLELHKTIKESSPEFFEKILQHIGFTKKEISEILGYLPLKKKNIEKGFFY